MIWVTYWNSFGGVLDGNYDIIMFISKCLYFKKTNSEPILLTSSKFQPCLLKKPLKALKVKRIRNCVFKCNIYRYFLVKQNFLISSETMLMPAELKWCVTWYICITLGKDLLCVTVQVPRYILGKGAFLVSPIHEQSQKKVHCEYR